MLFQTLNLIVLIILAKVSLSHQFDKGKENFLQLEIFHPKLFTIHYFWTSRGNNVKRIKLTISYINKVSLV